MINHISKYFTLNRRERNGIIILSTVLFILVLIKYLLIYTYKSDAPPVYVIELDDITDDLSEQSPISEPENASGNSKSEKTTLFYFDPNTIGYEQASALGFPEKTARTLINYRNKGGKFYKPDDLQKLYGLHAALFNQLKPFIRIEKNNAFENKRSPKENESHYSSGKQQNITLEVNTADSLEWMKLKGIGPGRARSILKYRKMLGGFYTIDQVKEAYFIGDSLFNTIKANLTVNPALIQKLKVNSVDFKTLVHHPYLKYEGTKCIFALKRNKKITADDLKNSSCFSREQLEKVLIYLDFE